jgi:hypothetical protein
MTTMAIAAGAETRARHAVPLRGDDASGEPSKRARACTEDCSDQGYSPRFTAKTHRSQTARTVGHPILSSCWLRVMTCS